MIIRDINATVSIGVMGNPLRERVVGNMFSYLIQYHLLVTSPVDALNFENKGSFSDNDCF